MEYLVDMIIEAYIKTYGADKWDSLTDKQKHDAIMVVARTALIALDTIKEGFEDVENHI